MGTSLLVLLDNASEVSAYCSWRLRCWSNVKLPYNVAEPPK
jgi:hypothetical protein